MPVNERERRVGLNEAVFREVNERLEELGSTFGIADKLDLVCECGDLECRERIAMTAAEYEEVRSHPTHFAVVPGHETGRVEKIVRRCDGYDVVEKHEGEPAELAVQTDPRN